MGLAATAVQVDLGMFMDGITSAEAFEIEVDTREPGSSLGTGGMSTKAAASIGSRHVNSLAVVHV